MKEALLQVRVQLIKYIQIIREEKQMLSDHQELQTNPNCSIDSYSSDMWMHTQYEDSITEEISAFSYNQAFLPPKEKTFWVYKQRTFSKLDTTEKITEYLDNFIRKVGTVKVDKGLQAVLAFYQFAPSSFLSLLLANCRRLLEEGKCDDQLTASTIYTAVMMIEPERFLDKSEMTKQGMRRLLKK